MRRRTNAHTDNRTHRHMRIRLNAYRKIYSLTRLFFKHVEVKGSSSVAYQHKRQVYEYARQYYTLNWQLKKYEVAVFL